MLDPIPVNAQLRVRIEELNAQISTFHVDISMPRRLLLSHQSRKGGKLAAYLDQRRVCGELRPFYSSLYFTPNIVLVSHFIIGRPFPNDGHGRLRSPWALHLLVVQHPISLTHLPDHEA